MPGSSTYRVHHVRRLGPATFVLRFDRHGLPFEPGQYLNLGLPGSIARREYSIYSGAADDYLEVLVREIEGGLVSPALGRCEPADVVAVDGPYGLFTTEPRQRSGGRYLFVGTGTGVSPFRCFTRSYPRIDYMLLHGVRSADEHREDGTFDPSRCFTCVSREDGGDFRGRVTDYLRGHPAEPDRLAYLCGNSDMIYEVFAILRGQGVPREHLFAEVYF